MNYERLMAALDRPGQDLGVVPELAQLRPRLEIHLHETLDSTNQQAWQLVDQGKGAGTVVIANQQTAGRGQRGRQWLSAAGGLYLSLVLEPDLAIADATLLTFASAWGIATALANLGLPLQLKWPNDLVYQGHKVGGILTETRISKTNDPTQAPENARFRYAVIGVGINWMNPLPANGMSLRQLLPDTPEPRLKTLEDLAAIALRGILQGYQYWQHQGTSHLINAYQRKLHNLGKLVEVNGHFGKVSGVSLQGELLIIFNFPEKKATQYLKPGEISLGYNV